MRQFGLADAFQVEEIEEIITQDFSGVKKRSFWTRLRAQAPSWLGRSVLVVLVLGALVLVAMWFKGRAEENRPGPRVVDRPPLDQLQPTPTPGDEEEPPLFPLPDPPSGRLRLDPERPGDPPPFEIAIAEVSCEEYQLFLRMTQTPPPAHWNGPDFPPGHAQRPATGMTWDQAMSYCEWYALKESLEPASVRLPTIAEFKRSLRGRTPVGDPLARDFWQKARLSQARESDEVKGNRWDRVQIPEKGQIYDLMGNVTEWGYDNRDGQHPHLGGGFHIDDPTFNPLTTRWRRPSDTGEAVGFRYVHMLNEDAVPDGE